MLFGILARGRRVVNSRSRHGLGRPIPAGGCRPPLRVAFPRRRPKLALTQVVRSRRTAGRRKLALARVLCRCGPLSPVLPPRAVPRRLPAPPSVAPAKSSSTLPLGSPSVSLLTDTATVVVACGAPLAGGDQRPSGGVDLVIVEGDRLAWSYPSALEDGCDRVGHLRLVEHRLADLTRRRGHSSDDDRTYPAILVLQHVTVHERGSSQAPTIETAIIADRDPPSCGFDSPWSDPSHGSSRARAPRVRRSRRRRHAPRSRHAASGQQPC